MLDTFRFGRHKNYDGAFEMRAQGVMGSGVQMVGKNKSILCPSELFQGFLENPVKILMVCCSTV